MSNKKERKRTKCEVWSRVCGYLRPTSQFNDGKEAEFHDRVKFKVGEKELKDEKSKIEILNRKMKCPNCGIKFKKIKNE